MVGEKARNKRSQLYRVRSIESLVVDDRTFVAQMEEFLLNERIKALMNDRSCRCVRTAASTPPNAGIRCNQSFHGVEEIGCVSLRQCDSGFDDANNNNNNNRGVNNNNNSRSINNSSNTNRSINNNKNDSGRSIIKNRNTHIGHDNKGINISHKRKHQNDCAVEEDDSIKNHHDTKDDEQEDRIVGDSGFLNGDDDYVSENDLDDPPSSAQKNAHAKHHPYFTISPPSGNKSESKSENQTSTKKMDSKATAAEAVAHAREKRMQEVSKEQLSVDIKTCYQRVNEEMNVAMKKQDRIREANKIRRQRKQERIAALRREKQGDDEDIDEGGTPGAHPPPPPPSPSVPDCPESVAASSSLVVTPQNQTLMPSGQSSGGIASVGEFSGLDSSKTHSILKSSGGTQSKRASTVDSEPRHPHFDVNKRVLSYENGTYLAKTDKLLDARDSLIINRGIQGFRGRQQDQASKSGAEIASGGPLDTRQTSARHPGGYMSAIPGFQTIPEPSQQTHAKSGHSGRSAKKKYIHITKCAHPREKGQVSDGGEMMYVSDTTLMPRTSDPINRSSLSMSRLFPSKPMPSPKPQHCQPTRDRVKEGQKNNTHGPASSDKQYFSDSTLNTHPSNPTTFQCMSPPYPSDPIPSLVSPGQKVEQADKLNGQEKIISRKKKTVSPGSPGSQMKYASNTALMPDSAHSTGQSSFSKTSPDIRLRKGNAKEHFSEFLNWERDDESNFGSAPMLSEFAACSHDSASAIRCKNCIEISYSQSIIHNKGAKTPQKSNESVKSRRNEAKAMKNQSEAKARRWSYSDTESQSSATRYSAYREAVKRRKNQFLYRSEERLDERMIVMETLNKDYFLTEDGRLGRDPKHQARDIREPITAQYSASEGGQLQYRGSLRIPLNDGSETLMDGSEASLTSEGASSLQAPPPSDIGSIQIIAPLPSLEKDPTTNRKSSADRAKKTETSPTLPTRQDRDNSQRLVDDIADDDDDDDDNNAEFSDNNEEEDDEEEAWEGEEFIRRQRDFCRFIAGETRQRNGVANSLLVARASPQYQDYFATAECGTQPSYRVLGALHRKRVG